MNDAKLSIIRLGPNRARLTIKTDDAEIQMDCPAGQLLDFFRKVLIRSEFTCGEMSEGTTPLFFR